MRRLDPLTGANRTGSIRAMNGQLHAGAAMIDITPSFPVPLAGFAARSGLSRGVTRPLSLRAFVFSDPDGNHALLVVADLLAWAPERVGPLRRRIAAHWPVPEAHIILHATHTHSGPQTSTRYAPSLGVADARYVTFLERQLFAAIELAWTRREPVTIERGDGRSTIGINRRVWRGDEVVIGPNPDGPVDRDLAVLRLRAAGGETRAILVHAACHPTTTMENYVSSEFPGAMCAALAGDAPGAVVAFLQGCCGDINPRPTRDRGTRDLNDDDVAAIGLQLAGEVRAVLDRPMRRLMLGPIRGRRVTAALPVERVPTIAELERTRDADGVLGEWSRLLLADPARLQPAVPLELLRLSVGPELTLLAMDAELTMPYGAHIKQRYPGALPLPYSNGLLGYVVTRQQLREGGYEPEGSTPYFGLPSRFQPASEAIAKTAMDDALADDLWEGP